jgi:hypothetical protein
MWQLVLLTRRWGWKGKKRTKEDGNWWALSSGNKKEEGCIKKKTSSNDEDGLGGSQMNRNWAEIERVSEEEHNKMLVRHRY